MLFGAPDRIRTCDPCLRRAVLYPAELRALTLRTGIVQPVLPSALSAALKSDYNMHT